jgi:nucleotide-binding universal stress UspA family protein
LAQHLESIKEAASEAGSKPPEVRRERSRLISTAVNGEAAKGYDLVLVGASGQKRGIRGQKLEDLVAGAPCHVAIVKSRGEPGPFRRLLVPVDGGFPSRVAMEFAVRYAEGAGPAAEVTFAIVMERTMHSEPPLAELDTVPTRARRKSIIVGIGALTEPGGLDKLSPVFKATKVRSRVVAVDGGSGGGVLEHAGSGTHDLLVLGAEHRAIHHRLFFGYDNERLVEASPIPVVLLVPKVPA